MRKHVDTRRTRWLCAAMIVATCAAAFAANASPLVTEPHTITIATTKVEVTDKALTLCYRITNRSDTDAWLCDSMNAGAPWSVEVHLDKDGETLLVQRRLDLPMEGSGEQPIGRYVRVRSGKSRSEMISLALPVNPQRVLSGSSSRGDLLDATRLAVQIGYYTGDLPRKVLNLMDQDERSPAKKTERMPLPAYPHNMLGWFGGTLHFTICNENVSDRAEQVLIPWSDQMFREEGVLGVVIDGIRIPYLARSRETATPDLSACDRLAITFHPSALSFFFPYDGQQGFLSAEERNFLRSQTEVAVDDSYLIGTLAGEVKKGLIGAFVKQGASAELLCAHGVREVTSLMVYDDISVVTREGEVFLYRRGLPSLRRALLQIQPIDLRLQCAGNLEHLWHRLRLYRVAKYAAVDLAEWWDRYDSQAGKTAYPAGSSGQEHMAYPPFGEWCDAMLRAYQVAASRDSALKAHKCPGAGDGRSHYAMNPNCEPDSPGEMVLLFETKAGWNQHGGPELFAFDNHDPKGGCVLLNDGTVKFIRTEEELHALRWR